jgi:hypothetical protein
MATESDVQLLSGGSGPLIRTLTVTTILNGEPTSVQMEVTAISDPNGNVIFPPVDRQDEILIVLKEIRTLLSLLAMNEGAIEEITDVQEADEESEDLN